ncbi:hypothetical protein BKA56DRAFT_615414 [Ilyonectria sp. MPI-CAGE-AT-0026]|nr:hypothetical protein BKA56DRAFT_615414 [Ilyonectria sp. MPI-CAGE-AT-0026]
MRLSGLLMLKLESNLSSQVSLKDVKSWATADVEVHGLMEQHLIEHVTKRLEGWIDAAQQAATQSFYSTKKSMEGKEAALKASCRVAIDSLEEKRKPWHETQKNVHSAFGSAKQEAERFRNDLQAGVDHAEQA